MHDQRLQARAVSLLDSALARVYHWPEVSPLRQAVFESRTRLGRPMRLALAGLVKAGKSTMVNSLLGLKLVATGAVETTYNVNWLSDGETYALEVEFKAGVDRRSENQQIASVEELAQSLDTLTRRRQEDPTTLDEIHHIRARLPHPLLRVFEIIDTPGLQSVYRMDDHNTRSFLGMSRNDRTDVTRAESSNADAILYLLKGNLGAADLLSLQELRDPALARSTPLQTIGALTMTDVFWPDSDDPLATAREIIRNRHINLPDLSQTFFAILPVAAECALGAATLSESEHQTLKSLALIGPDRLKYFLKDHNRFCGRDDADLPPPATRTSVWERLGRWGVWKATEIVRGGVADRAELVERLDEASGVRELRDMLADHFGRRSQLLQLHRVCLDVSHACALERMGDDPERKSFASRIAAEFERLYLEEPAFDALRLLGRLYEGRLDLNDAERDDVLRVTGERGTTDSARLGAPEDATPTELANIAERKRRYWHVRAGDMLSAPTDRDAARTLAAAYARFAMRTHTSTTGDTP